MSTKKTTLFFTTAILLISGHSSFGGPLITQSPTPDLGPRTTPQDILRCQRLYVYQGKPFPCDSPLATDGEGLRPLLKPIAKATQELDDYQEGRKHLKITAYTGIAGILVGVLGPRLYEDRASKNAAMGIGFSITLGSLAFGRLQLLKNELHLEKAISYFNEANPDHPIMIQTTSTR